MSLKPFNLKLSHKGLILVSIPLLFELIFVAVLAALLHQSELKALRAEHSRITIENSGLIGKLLFDGGTALITYTLTRHAKDGERVDQIVNELPAQFSRVNRLVGDDRNQQEILSRMGPAVMKVSMLMAEIKRTIDTDDRFSLGMRVGLLINELMTDIRNLTRDAELLALQQRKITSPTAESQARLWLKYWLLAGVVLNVMLALFLAVSFSRGTIRRLNTLMDNTRRLASGRQLNETLAGADEIAELDRFFHEMADVLAQAARMKQEVAAMVSHDLKTPLSSIQNCLTLIEVGRYGELSREGKEAIAIAERNIGRLLNLVSDLLELERIEAGQLAMDLKVVQFSSILKRSLEAVQGFADLHAVTLEAHHCEAAVIADPDRLVQVLVNLLSNAIKFSPRGAAVSLQTAEQAEMLVVRITDRGRGIPEAERERIFERFQQVQSADASIGTGLGLAICKRIVEGHGGTIGVDSELGHGSTFWFRVPLSRQQ